jgi:ribosomal protein L37E
MKPLYGTFEHVSWMNFDKQKNELTCHKCGTKSSGSRIRTCEQCGAYPRWKYKSSVLAIVKAYIHYKLYHVVCSMIGFLKRIKNKLDDCGIE